MAELSLEKAIELTKLLEKHTYGQEEKKMDNDPRWITDREPNKEGLYWVTQTNDLCAENEEQRIVTDVCFFSKSNVWFTSEKVLAWMPMPPAYIPPKAEEPAEKKCKNCKWFKWEEGHTCMMLNNDKDGNRTFVCTNNPEFTCGLWEEA